MLLSALACLERLLPRWRARRGISAVSGTNLTKSLRSMSYSSILVDRTDLGVKKRFIAIEQLQLAAVPKACP